MTERLLALQGCDQDIQRLTESLAALRETLTALSHEDTGESQAEHARLSAVQIHTQIRAAERTLRTKRRKRTVLSRALVPTFLSEYERIFLHRGEVAVVQVIDEICQGCHIRLPPQLCLELRRTGGLICCPHCHRLVYRASTETPTVVKTTCVANTASRLIGVRRAK